MFGSLVVGETLVLMKVGVVGVVGLFGGFEIVVLVVGWLVDIWVQ